MITDADLEMAVPVPEPTAENPFVLGWRYRDGGAVELPLTPADLLWQEEGDQIVTNDHHDQDMKYLAEVLRWRVLGRAGLRVFSDHCIDFQVEGLGIIGPDAILFNGEPREWDGSKGTFPVRDMAARPLYAFEITSPSTRSRNLKERFDQYFVAGVPVYVIVDAPYGGGKRPRGVVGFQAGPTGYEPLAGGPDGRVWVEVADVWVGLEAGRLACYLPTGERIADAITTRGHLAYALEQLTAARGRADEAARAAAAERQRADEAARAAAAERQRADETLRKVAELEAELRRLRGEPNTPNT